MDNENEEYLHGYIIISYLIWLIYDKLNRFLGSFDWVWRIRIFDNDMIHWKMCEINDVQWHDLEL